MRLLVVTQKVDSNDSNLGFFHAWILELAKRVDRLYVICLQEGTHNLPDNVTVLSLGKEAGIGKWGRVQRFFRYVWSYRKHYDNVLVHMNPEYIVLAGWLWRLWGKKVALWYTHKAVNLKLRIAEKFATKIFTASVGSFRLKSKKVMVVGHGIPIGLFAKQQWNPGGGLPHKLPGTIFLMTAGRISYTKDLKTVFGAVAELIKKRNPPVSYNGYGRPITKNDLEYKKEIEDYAIRLDLPIKIQDITNPYSEMPKLFQTHHLLIHTSQTGSMDKVVLEALAAGRIVVTSSEAYKHLDGSGFVFWFPPGNPEELAKTIEKIYRDGILAPGQLPNQKAIEYVKKHHNLETLIGKIINYFV